MNVRECDVPLSVPGRRARAATRAAELGARTVLVTRGEFGGMAANEARYPVRTLAHAAGSARRRRSSSSMAYVLNHPLDYAVCSHARAKSSRSGSHSTLHGK